MSQLILRNLLSVALKLRINNFNYVGGSTKALKNQFKYVVNCYFNCVGFIQKEDHGSLIHCFNPPGVNRFNLNLSTNLILLVVLCSRKNKSTQSHLLISLNALCYCCFWFTVFN